MRTVEHLDFSKPDEVRPFGHGRAELLEYVGRGHSAARPRAGLALVPGREAGRRHGVV